MTRLPLPWPSINRTGVVAFSGSGRAEPEELHQVVWPVLAGLLTEVPVPRSFVTGACVGVDAYCAAYLRTRGCMVHTVVPDNRSRIDPAFVEHCTTYELMPPDSSYRARNERMVAYVERLVAFPEWTEEEDRDRHGSGTWMTIRIARRAGLRVDVHPLQNRTAGRIHAVPPPVRRV